VSEGLQSGRDPSHFITEIWKCVKKKSSLRKMWVSEGLQSGQHPVIFSQKFGNSNV